MNLSDLALTVSVGILAAGLAAAAPRFATQEPKGVAPLESKSTGDKSDPSMKKWIDQLGSPEFDERDAAIEHLRSLGKNALGVLDDAASKSEDPEIRWNARRLARDIRDGKTKATPRSKAKGMMPLREVPRAQDPLGAQDPQDSQSALELPDLNNLDNDLRSDIERLHQELRSLRRSYPQMGLQSWRGGLQSLDGANSNVQVQIHDGQVKVTTHEKDVNGEEKSETYEAESIEQFREKYPEVAKRYLDGVSFFHSNQQPFVFRTPTFRMQAPLAPATPFFNNPNEDEDHALIALGESQNFDSIIGEENGERLGVHVAAVHPSLAKFLGLEAGRGFVVESVEPGSLAESLGLKTNDVVISIAGKKIGEEATIREALASVESGAKLRVDLARGLEGKMSLEAKKTKPAASEPSSSDEPRPVEKRKRSTR